jgi:hypothetical protein
MFPMEHVFKGKKVEIVQKGQFKFLPKDMIVL